MAFEIAIKDDVVEVTSPEGEMARMSLKDLLEESVPSTADSGAAPLPTGVRFVRSRRRTTVWVHETPPQIWNLKWIRSKPGRKRKGERYREVVVGLPYMITIAAFVPGERGGLTLSNSHECFFRNEPLAPYEHDQLHVPCLLNCSLFEDPAGKDRIGVDGKPVIWICTQHLDRARFDGLDDERRRMIAGFQTLMTMLIGSGFNYSSEQHEFCSGFTASTGVDPRVSSVEAWEEATEQAPHGAVTMPWLPTGYTVKEVVDRMFTRLGAATGEVRCAADVARIVFRGRTGDGNGKGGPA